VGIVYRFEEHAYGGFEVSPDGRDPPPDEGTLAEQLYRKISEAIVEGELAPGSKISEPALARRYGVSRSPLREALHRLQARRLITRSANHGPRVVKPTTDTLAEIFMVREALEGMAARAAASRASKAEIAAMQAAIAKHTASLEETPGDRKSTSEQDDRDFHFMIAQASGSPMLIELLCSELYPLLRLYRGQHAVRLGHNPRAVVEHQRILAAIEDGDAEIAELQMRRHIAAASVRRAEALGLTAGA
jgi:DNA-binding GntR family transcriptional regulator